MGNRMKDPVDHILRPQLPWRSGPGITECGLNAAKAPTLSREAYIQRVKDLGKQRAAMVTCMTCAVTAMRWGTWDDDPRLAFNREIEWERGSRYWSARTDRGEVLRDELLAIAALIETHRDEFDAHLTEIVQRREWVKNKADLAAKRSVPKPRPIGGL
jgi:hypothetical protein